MRSQIRKWSLLGLAVCVALSLAACGSSGSSTTVLPPDGGNGDGNGNGDLPPPAGLTVNDDTYAWLGNTAITVPSEIGVLANDVGHDGTVTFDTTGTNGTLDTTGLTGGAFTYQPPTGAVLPFTDTFAYTATDGTAQITGTVTITVNQEAWFVNNGFVGTSDGSSAAPFTTLAAAAAASVAGDTIFVHAGVGSTGQSAGIDLLPNQRLIGEGVGLTFDVEPNGTPLAVPLTVVAPGAPPVILDTVTNVGNLPIVGLASGVEVAGITVDGTGTIANLNGMSGAEITGFNIHGNTIRNVPRAGIELTGVSGGTGMIVNNTLTDLIGPNPDNAINIVTTAAGVDFTIASNTLDTVTETGIRVQFPSGTVTVADNTLTNVGTTAGRRGIDIEGAGTTTISGNIVDNSGPEVQPIARSGIQVSAIGTLAARVTGNTVLNASDEDPLDGGIQAQTETADSTLCLQMTDNATDSGFTLDNRETNLAASFRIEGPLQGDFEAANTLIGGNFVYRPDANTVSFVPVGTCGFAP